MYSRRGSHAHAPLIFQSGCRLGSKEVEKAGQCRAAQCKFQAEMGLAGLSPKFPVAGSSKTRMIESDQWTHSVGLGESRATSADVCRDNRGSGSWRG